jgi:very-long-chain ceramide synthase
MLNFVQFSKLLNYIQWERAKVVSFLVFICVWTYVLPQLSEG